MGVLWYSIGASRPYEIFAGCAELTGGILLFIPQTALLGALICLADTIQIFVLNMTYDVPVKLFSFHLILMSLFLLAPDARRLLNVLLLNRTAQPSTLLPIGHSPRRRRIALIAQIIVGAYLVGMNLNQGLESWAQYGGGAPKSPLYGIWTIERMTIDGQERSPLVTDYDRYRRAVFDRPAGMAFQRMDETFVTYGAKIDLDKKLITLARPNAPSPGTLAYERPAADRLILKGDIERRQVAMDLRLFNRSNFLLVNRGFHWIQEYPFNR